MERGRSSSVRKEISKQYRSSRVETLFIADEALKRREQGYNERGRRGHLKCDVPGCEVVFADSSKKENHWRAVHRKERSIKCEYAGCEAKFFENTQLRRHEKDVHKTKRFDCPKCDKSFSRQWNFSKHMETKHGDGSSNSNRNRRSWAVVISIVFKRIIIYVLIK